MNAEQIHEIIRILNLQPLPVEGGMFAQTYVSAERIPSAGLPPRYTASRPFSTAIYYLLTAETSSFSALHRLATDEIYHFYLGDPVELVLLLPGGTSRRVILGQDILGSQSVQFCAPAGVWQGSALLPGGDFALLGTTMAPGFDPADFTLGSRIELLAGWPGEAAAITRLTRF